jgi:LysM repeat protein
VAKLRDSDKVQNLRLGELERDVSSIKRGGKSSGARYDGGTDLAAHTTYVARPGDTLFRIASTHRVSVGEIQQLNRMTEDEVRVGQTLLIPSPHRLSSPTTQANYRPSTPGSSSAPTASASSYHTVKKGDSLKAIAIKHKMTTATLASANGIKDVNKIFVGQRLKIPGRSSSVASTTRSTPPARESSDTVPLPGFGITETAPPPAAALAPAPTAPAPAPAPAPAAPAKPAASTADTHRGILAYRVDRSDTIESIATQFSTTPDRIREINRLNASTTLKSGDEIMVPAMGAVSVSGR